MVLRPTGPDVPSAAPGAEDDGYWSPSPRPAAAAAVAARSREVADAVGALVAVSGALAGYVLTRPVRQASAVVRGLVFAHPVRRERQLLHDATLSLRGRAGRRLLDAVGEVADVVLPRAAEEALGRLDVTALVLEHVDLDRIAAALDVEAVIAGVDLDAVIEKVDIARVIDRVDLDEVVSRVDLDRAVDGVDLDRIIDKVDIDRVLDRVDLDEVVSRVDLDRAVDGVDLDRIIARADVVAIARYVVEQLDIPDLIRTSTGSVTTEMVRGGRGQSADADRAAERDVDRLLRRHGRRPAGPSAPPA